MKIQSSLVFLSIFIGVLSSCSAPQPVEKIDREALVKRHRVLINSFDSLSSLTVGNGEFAFTVDATGLQSFPEVYAKGISLGTFSDWGWHSFPNLGNYKYEETLREVDYRGRKITYDVQWNNPERNKQAANYFRVNPHRMHLGMIGLEMINGDGSPVKPENITGINQYLDPWEGVIYSSFLIEGDTVKVTTLCHPDKDAVAARIESPRIARRLLRVRLTFPYPSGEHVDNACDWNSPEKHRSDVIIDSTGAQIFRILDTSAYVVNVAWKGNAKAETGAPHVFYIQPAEGENELSFTCTFSNQKKFNEAPGFDESYTESIRQWKDFWMLGGAVDFTGSTDPRANELERRIVLSQYLTRAQCTGLYPPQETGLTFNSWYGKFHLEMHWWHAVHFALWDRIHLMEKSLDWYEMIAPEAGKIATRQGFSGVRWPKMVGPDGVDSPSSVGSYLIWQQPHYIYMSELFYRNSPDSAVLRKYGDLVFATTDMMADYAMPESDPENCQLGPWLIPAQERLPAETTINPPYELAYWYWGIQTAIQWKERMGLSVPEKWQKVLKNLPPLGKIDTLYLAAGNVPDSYTNARYTGDHPAVFGALGAVPATPLTDAETMKSTYNYILNNWDWPSTWGWDYPMMAMTATRLGMPEKAVDALMMEVQKNTYLPNGHNYQNQRLPIYLPGNGGLLAAVALMCAGYDGCTVPLPGFPKDGSWKVRWENLQKMP